jgi:hypothetical protein
MGESSRLDYVIREHEKLQRRVELLTELLIEQGVLPRAAVEASADASESAPADESS